MEQNNKIRLFYYGRKTKTCYNLFLNNWTGYLSKVVADDIDDWQGCKVNQKITKQQQKSGCKRRKNTQIVVGGGKRNADIKIIKTQEH